MNAHDVTAVIPTRGDHDLRPVVESLIFGRVIIWDNADRDEDLATFGRWQAVREAAGDVFYSQDDDCIVPRDAQEQLLAAYRPDRITVNMTAGHNNDFPGLFLFGWGSIFHRDVPLGALDRWHDAGSDDSSDGFRLTGCDIIAGMLSRCERLDLGRRDLDYAHADDRVHNSAGYADVKRRFYTDAFRLARARGTRSAADGNVRTSAGRQLVTSSSGAQHA